MTNLDAIADELLDAERLGKQTPLPESWCPGDECPKTGAPCERDTRCWEAGACALRPTLTSRLAARGGRYLARWAAEAGATDLCAGCAFREGTRANRTDGTIIDVVSCLESGDVFYCHEGLAHGETPTRPCRGWEALALRTHAESDDAGSR